MRTAEISLRELAKLRRLANTEPLSGLSNVRHFREQFKIMLTKAGATGRPLSLLFIEVDHFKKINDEHDHDAGDQAIDITAKRLRKFFLSLGFKSLVCRYGGDEFVILLLGASKERALSAAEKIRSEFEKNLMELVGKLGKVLVPVTIRVGVATYPDDTALGSSSILTIADQAAMIAKALGGNRVCKAEDLAGSDRLYAKVSANREVVRGLKDFSSEEILSALASLASIVGAERLENLLSENPYFFSQMIKTCILVAEQLPKDLPFLRACQLVAGVITPEIFSQAFDHNPQAPILSIKRMYDSGQGLDPKNPEGPNFLVYFQELQRRGVTESVFLGDYIQNPEAAVMVCEFMAFNPQIDLPKVMERNHLSYPSEILGISGRKYPGAKTIQASRSPTASLSGYFPSTFPRSGGINIAEHAASQLERKTDPEGKWLTPGEISWIGLRLNASNTCPLRCIYCEQDVQKEKIPVSEWVKQLEILSRDEEGRTRSGIFLNITGGEPTTYGPRGSSLIELIQQAKRLGMIVSINTNGVLIDHDLAMELVRSGLNNVNVTLNSDDSKVHNELVRIKNSSKNAWELTLEAIGHLDEARGIVKSPMSIVINTVVTTRNCGGLADFAEFVGMNTQADDINPLPVKDAEDLYLSVAQIENFRRRILPRILRLSKVYGFYLLPTKAIRIFGQDSAEYQLASRGIYHFRPAYVPCATAGTSIYLKYNGTATFCCYGADHPDPGLTIGNFFKGDLSKLRTDPGVLEGLNKLPWGNRVCQKFCGPDVTILNERILMRLNHLTRRSDYLSRKRIHDFCQRHNVNAGAVALALKEIAESRRRTFARVCKEYTLGEKEKQEHIVQRAKELLVQNPGLERRVGFSLRTKIDSLQEKYKSLDKEKIGVSFRLLNRSLEGTYPENHEVRVLECLGLLLTKANKTNEDPLTLTQQIIVDVEEKGEKLTRSNFKKALRTRSLPFQRS